jgi:hypothetical protein
MRVRKATIAGVGINPNALAIFDLDVGTEVPYELELSLGDLRPEFFRIYADWLADMREFPDPDDEIEDRLRALRWPSLGVLVEVEPALFAVVMLVLGKEVLADLEHGRDALVQVQWVPRPADEVELRGRRIVMRGTAIALPVRHADSGVMANRAAGSA